MIPAAIHPEPAAGAIDGAHALVMHALEWAVLGINTVCAAVLIWGVLIGIARFVLLEARWGKRDTTRWPALRQRVGQYLLFGLELLIAADIIETMIRPTLSQLAILGGVSLLRIVTGYALGRELNEIAAKDPHD
ncbi:MAG: hypothetical protein DHS20C14_01920 [Phycisphaeraceae bacterium]|nr:MAG: hypothetical protein DHS20C14_01920 [Phycisphaeraceae bacterium]